MFRVKKEYKQSCAMIQLQHSVGAGWVHPRAGLNAVEHRKISCSYQESNPGYPALSLSLCQFSYNGSQYLQDTDFIFWWQLT
jgi:hypothetical protein